MIKKIVWVSWVMILLSSCQEWRLAKEKEDRVTFDVEENNNSDRKRRDEKKEKEETIKNTGNKNTVYITKYAAELGVKPDELANEQLYACIDEWIGTPYKYAGNTKEGVDCSGFVNAVYLTVFKVQLQRSATQIIGQCTIISKNELKEGDLVFFDIGGKNSHIGIYLVNDKFVHASSSKGVMISDLNQAYWLKYWGRAGRLK